MTEIELELNLDIHIHFFIEQGMRRGIFYIAKRHSKADYKYMRSSDVNKASKFIMYLDENNLHVWTII